MDGTIIWTFADGQQNSEFVFESIVRDLNNVTDVAFYRLGYYIVNICNGGFDSNKVNIKSVAQQGDWAVAFLEAAASGGHRFNILWHKK